MKNQTITNLVLTIFQANGNLIKFGDQLTSPSKLTSAKWQILGPLNKKPDGMTAPRIAEAMGLSRQGAQKQLNILLAEGLIKQKSNPARLRSPLYLLTQKGERALRDINSRWFDWVSSVSKKFTRSEIEIAIETLVKLTNLLCKGGN